jgi:hypothetical protein
MTAQLVASTRFIRKTQLRPNEYHKNFHKVDQDIIAFVTSKEADRVTPLMSKIYLRLVGAPVQYFEREGVLRFESEVRAEKMLTAWSVLCDLVGVASATASKALAWMHEQGIIGYFAGKNGVGIRIFLNRAAGSIGVRTQSGGQKILSLVPASSNPYRTSANEVAFNDSFAVLENSDTDFNSRAPENGADNKHSDKTPPEPPPDMVTVDRIITKLKAELEPAMHTAVRQAAAREHERTREWLENRGLPKAARVAQHEAYNVLRKYGVISESTRRSSAQADVGRSDYTPPEPHKLSPDEITDMAGVCVAMLETKGQSIEITLSEMSTEAGGFLLPEDARHVREKVNYLLSERNSREGK